MSKDQLIFALDVTSKEEALELVAELRDEVGAFKIGLQLFTAEGASFVRHLVEGGHRIFLDLKFHDIPNTVAAASVEAARMGVWMFNLHAAGGEEMMKKAAVETRAFCSKESLPEPLIIGVTVLTSSSASTLRSSGVMMKPEELVVKYARSAHECGLDGVVASPLEARIIKTELETDKFLVVTPGIRPAFATKDDQKRVTTPRSAVQSGADFLVVGRPIRMAEDRIDAARRIVKEMA